MSFTRIGMDEVRAHAAAHSDDPDTQVGASIRFRDTTYVKAANKLPPGLTYTKDRTTRPEKYAFIQHAEVAAIAAAAKEGIETEGATMYCTLFPCNVCAQAIIMAGIVRLVTEEPDWARDSASHYTEALEMLTEAGVEIHYVSG